MGRIYEVSEYFHVDLARIISIRQCVEKSKHKGRNGTPEYDCWIELTTNNNVVITFDSTIKKINDTYDCLLKAWKNYVGDDIITTELPPYGENLHNWH